MEDKRPNTLVVVKFKMPDIPDTITDSGSPEMYDRLMAFLGELQAYDIEFDSEPLDELRRLA